MAKINSNSILFLYEGDTELEFYESLFEKYLPPRSIRLKKKNIKGQGNLNRKVESAIYQHLDEKSDEDNIHVFVAHDREGPREKESMFDPEYFDKKVIRKKGSRIKSVNEIVATQDVESWFFADLDGIYDYLKVPKNKRNYRNYRNIESLDYTKLSQLFRRFGKIYFKGERAEGLIQKLNVQKIYESIPEIQNAIEKMTALIP